MAFCVHFCLCMIFLPAQLQQGGIDLKRIRESAPLNRRMSFSSDVSMLEQRLVGFIYMFQPVTCFQQHLLYT